MDEVVVFHLTGGVKASRMILGLLVCLTVVGLPLGLWLLAWSRARVELRPDGVRCRTGGFVRYDQVQRFGKGEREAALEPGEVEEFRMRTVHYLLLGPDGQKMAVHPSVFSDSDTLTQMLEDRLGRPEALEVLWPFQRLRFPPASAN